MKNKYINNTNKRIARTIRKHDLLTAGDKILIALSGGKDSMILLESLVECKKHLPFNIDLIATHVLIENIGYKTDLYYLEDFCKRIDVKFILKKFEIDLEKNNKKSTCFICSWNRRKALFNLTEELNCNKLAFGHHMDDALQTLFLNMIYHGSISSLPFKFSMFQGRIEVIRPLLEIAEEELIEYAKIKKYKSEIKQCKYENTKRIDMKKLINSINEKHAVGKKNIFRSMDNIYSDYLPHWNK